MHRTIAACWLLLAIEAIAGTPTRLTLEDAARARRVPVEIYEPLASTCNDKCGVLIFGTGYRATLAEYSFLFEALGEAGFLVVGVQHDLDHDLPMPQTGDVLRDRTPYWDRGVANLEFVVRALKFSFPNQEWGRLILAGHSQGGDIAARAASMPRFPVRALVTLDNRRAPLPASSAKLQVLTIRSSDQAADPGVLPDTDSQNATKTCIVRMASTRHDDMNNSADESAKAKIIQVVLRFLRLGRCPSDA